MQKKYIVRTKEAGVFYGEIVSHTHDEVIMNNVRKLWQWNGACAVEQLAQDYTVDENDADKEFTDFLDEVRIMVNYKRWFAGHFHVNRYATESDNIKILYEGTDVLI